MTTTSSLALDAAFPGWAIEGSLAGSGWAIWDSSLWYSGEKFRAAGRLNAYVAPRAKSEAGMLRRGAKDSPNPPLAGINFTQVILIVKRRLLSAAGLVL